MKHLAARSPFLLAGLVLGAACGSDDSASPSGSSAVVINEIVPSNKGTCTDEAGGYADWLELYNKSDTVVDLGGYSLTDNPAVPRKAVLPAGLILAPKGVLTFWADGATTEGTTHLPFKLSAAGEGISLFDAAGKQVDQYTWPTSVTDISFARLPDGTGAFVSCAKPTCGTANGATCTP